MKKDQLKGKVYILDTNVLVHDPESINNFQDNIVCIPLTVIRELDKLKKDAKGRGSSARAVLRTIERLRNGGDLRSGVRINKGMLFVTNVCKGDTTDDNLIETAKEINRNIHSFIKRKGYYRVVLVSKDVAVRIKANAQGVLAEDYKTDKTTIHEKYGNLMTKIDSPATGSVRYFLDENEQIFRVTKDSLFLIKLGKTIFGITPKTKEQECAIDALLNPAIEVVAINGKAGTGKTLLALAAALHQTNRKDALYEQVIVARPIVTVGADIGYLPGNVDEKLTPWMQPIFDNLEVLTNTEKPHQCIKQKYKGYQHLIDAGVLQVEALTYIRGRTLPRRYFIIDEAQNLRPIDIKTIVTRCGEGTKIVFTGDISQIDASYLDKDSNGLAYIISRFINESNFCYLKLNTTIRSRVAEQGAHLL